MNEPQLTEQQAAIIGAFINDDWRASLNIEMDRKSHD